LQFLVDSLELEFQIIPFSSGFHKGFHNLALYVQTFVSNTLSVVSGKW
jgi:hypothetical protein